MADIRVRTETNILKSEIESKEAITSAAKDNFAKSLLNGLGDAMTAELRNPSKPSKKLARKLKKARKIEILKDNLKRIFGKKPNAEENYYLIDRKTEDD